MNMQSILPQQRHAADIRARLMNPQNAIASQALLEGPEISPPTLDFVEMNYPYAKTIVLKKKVYVFYEPHDHHVRAHYDFIRRIYGNDLTGEGAAWSKRMIIEQFKIVCPVDFTEIISHSRKASLAGWRHALFHTMRNNTQMSLPELGRVVGRRDHTTAINSIRVVEAAIADGTAVKHTSPLGIEFWVRKTTKEIKNG